MAQQRGRACDSVDMIFARRLGTELDKWLPYTVDVITKLQSFVQEECRPFLTPSTASIS